MWLIKEVKALCVGLVLHYSYTQRVFAENIKINHQLQNKIILVQDNYRSDS